MLVEAIFGTPLYVECFGLRERVLRIPLGMDFDQKDISEEYLEKHWAIIDNNYQVQGCITYRHIGKKTWKMRQVCIAPEFQNKGLGKCLVEESADYMFHLFGMIRVELAARDLAISFYESLGYQKVGKEFVEIGIKHWKMEKGLKS